MEKKHLIETIRAWMKPATPKEKADAHAALPPDLIRFAIVLGYNHPTRCVEDWAKHKGITLN